MPPMFIVSSALPWTMKYPPTVLLMISPCLLRCCQCKYIYHVIIEYKANNHHMFVILTKRNILYKFNTSLGNKYKTIINIVIIILWNKLEKEIFLAPNMFGVIFFQTTMWRLKRASMCDFNYMNLLMSHVTCLNNTHG